MLRKLGADFHALGGMNLMLSVTQLAAIHYQHSPNTLNRVWDGIGDWQR